jgi:hypothetical protein
VNFGQKELRVLDPVYKRLNPDSLIEGGQHLDPGILYEKTAIFCHKSIS